VDLITPRLAELIAIYGPWVLFAMAVLETSFVTGLVVPSGVATSFATVLALNTGAELAPPILAALTGGFVGDSLGFWIGRIAGARVVVGKGRWRGLARRRSGELGVTLRRHPLVSVTLARLVSFVRTLMPMAAGMSNLSYARFLAFEIPGLAAWVCLYVGIGVVAEESWQLATRVLGAGGALAMAGAVALVWWSTSRKAARSSFVAEEDAS